MAVLSFRLAFNSIQKGQLVDSGGPFCYFFIAPAVIVSFFLQSSHLELNRILADMSVPLKQLLHSCLLQLVQVFNVLIIECADGKVILWHF